jgi:hypothetical protein
MRLQVFGLGWEGALEGIGSHSCRRLFGVCTAEGEVLVLVVMDGPTRRLRRERCWW